MKTIVLMLCMVLSGACGVDTADHSQDLCTQPQMQPGADTDVSCQREPPPELPSCASLGCPVAPSGTGDMSKPWEPCNSDVCFCRSADGSHLVACEF